MADQRITDRAITIRLLSTADLGPARYRLYDELDAAGVEASVIDDLVLAVCELLTNALESAEPGTQVNAVATITTDVSERLGGRRLEVDIVNTGDPMPGRLRIDRNTQLGTRRHRGRGLVLAAQVGEVVIEGLVGGTKARFGRDLDDVAS